MCIFRGLIFRSRVEKCHPILNGTSVEGKEFSLPHKKNEQTNFHFNNTPTGVTDSIVKTKLLLSYCIVLALEGKKSCCNLSDAALKHLLGGRR